MKLVGLCPIGSLAEYGYRHVYRECIASHAGLCDAVYLVQSLPDPRGIGWLLENLPNVHSISGPRTLFPDGRYDVEFAQRRAEYDQRLVEEAGFDVMILLASNTYIPETRREALRDWCENFYRSRKSVGWIYRGDQLGGRLFHANKRLPYLIRLGTGGLISYVPDGAFCGDESYSPEAGNFEAYDRVALVDAAFELTLPELEAKINFVRGYHDILPKRPEVFAWSYWKKYYTNKLRTKLPSDEALSEVGLAIAANSQADFVCHELLKAIGLETGSLGLDAPGMTGQVIGLETAGLTGEAIS